MFYNVNDFYKKNKNINSTEECASDYTMAIQAAVDKAVAEGGGTVYFPAGEYRTGTIFLGDNLTLYIEGGAHIIGSPNIKDYGHCSLKPRYSNDVGNVMTDWYYALLVAENACNITICGSGVIDGNGKYKVHFPNPDDPQKNRPYLLNFYKCSHINIEGVTLQDSGMYAFFAIKCCNVHIHGVKIRNKESCNGDGLDFDGGNNIVISDCDIDSGDDCISPKSFTDSPVYNLTVTNCIFKSKWAGIRFGVESAADMKNIVVSNCVFVGCGDGIKVQCCGNGCYDGISFSNIVMKNVLRPFFITLSNFRTSCDEKSIITDNGKIRNVRISDAFIELPDENYKLHDVWTDIYNQRAMCISGLYDNHVENIYLSNIDITVLGDETVNPNFDIPEFVDVFEQYPEVTHFEGELPCSGIFIRNADNIVLKECNFTVLNNDKRPFLFCDSVRGRFDNLTFRNKAGDFIKSTESSIKINECRSNENLCTVTGLSLTETMAYETGKKQAAEYRRYVKELAKIIDKAISSKTVLTIKKEDLPILDGKYTITPKLNGEHYMLIHKFVGKFEILLNDEVVASHKPVEGYNLIYMFALKLNLNIDDVITIVLKSYEPGGHHGVGKPKINAGNAGSVTFSCKE